MKSALFSVAVAAHLLSASVFGAAIVKVNMDSGGLLLKDTNGTTDLTGGANGVIGDGAVIQLGYFSGATSNDNNFVGNFVPITGQGSANFANNTQFDSTVGDDGSFGPPDIGQFQTSIVFDQAAILSNLPAVGTVLSLRIFNRADLAASTHFMTISNNLWKWIPFADSTSPSSNLNISFADTGTRFENRNAAGGTASTPSGSLLASNPATIIPVPEPTVALLGTIGALSLVARRRKRM